MMRKNGFWTSKKSAFSDYSLHRPHKMSELESSDTTSNDGTLQHSKQVRAGVVYGDKLDN
eukprot:m.803666 g.803666  ORF g.803666 m.803666 type:complete len:60 (-) comp23367_c0_seq6:1978-2157(-)